ncbi:MAG TPA: SDR family oxidoreductase [Patescibacteria group bacterium]|nr:SDR family oxidoreductase [Patescibacteria group bacterium]
MSRFDGRVCLVTGSTGMAASAARAIVAEGGSVFVVSRTEGNVRALAGELGDRAGWAAADLTDEGAVEAAVAACVERFGRIDALYEVVGISGRRFGDGPIHEATLDGWRAVMDANATSLFLVARAVVRQMLTQEPDTDGQRGAILAMSSALAQHPSAVHFATHAYAASKGAVEGLTRAMAAHYAPHGIRVNAIAPSLVATPMSTRAQSDPAILAYLRQKQPLAGGPIEADAVTPVALHLLSRDARMVTGQVIEVDGGWSVSEPSP